MRDTVVCLVGDADTERIRQAIEDAVAEVSQYVPGYRLKQRVQFAAVEPGWAATLLRPGTPPPTTKVTVFLEVEGAAHHLPAYAGNLDIMTSAALRVGERLAERVVEGSPA